MLHSMMTDFLKEWLALGYFPFNNTRLHYFGLFKVLVKHSTDERWDFLLLCSTTHAVHFEVVPSRDTSSCVEGIERIVSRRGAPSLHQPSGPPVGRTSFASEEEMSNNILKWNQQVLTGILVKKCINYKFNFPNAPQHGGVWERLMKTFKLVSFAFIGNTNFTDEFLTTILCLAERSLNASSLVPAGANGNNLNVLTPNYSLLETASSLLSNLSTDSDHWKQYARAQAYSSATWSWWWKKYVVILNHRSNWFPPASRDR